MNDAIVGPEVYSVPCQTSKRSILDVWQGFE